MKLLKKKEFLVFLETLAKKNDFYAPTSKKEFGRIRKVDDICFDYTKTEMPAKSIFFPREEIMMRFSEKKIRIVKPRLKRKTIIFGLRSCDLVAIEIMDRIFENDLWYKARRENAILIGVACNKTDDSCFCASFGINPRNGDADLWVINEGESFFLQPKTSVGRKLVNKLLKNIPNTRKKPKKRRLKFKKKVLFNKKELQKLKELNFDNWKECLACGSCTTVCPTCHCFDVVDVVEQDFKRGVRKRVWASCMERDFSRIAGDLILRNKRTDRLRQFVLDKFIYFEHHYGHMGCVGCGRCIETCPVGIDIRKILSK